jgi:hypothetical protein
MHRLLKSASLIIRGQSGRQQLREKRVFILDDIMGEIKRHNKEQQIRTHEVHIALRLFGEKTNIGISNASGNAAESKRNWDAIGT